LNSGIFIIDNAGVETDYELWDPADNPNARFVKLTNSSLNQGGQSDDNSVIVSVHWNIYLTSKKWQIESKDLPSLTNITSGTVADTDFNGYVNCNLAYQDCNVTTDPSGYTLVEQYNNAHGTSITVDDYIPAIMHCKNISETFMGETIYGYLPSMG